MTTLPTLDELVADLDRSVQETLAYFEGPGQVNDHRIDRWGAWDVLAHFVYWHDATAWGIASAARGGPPWQTTADADTINAVCVAVRAGDTFDDLIAELRRSHQRLLRVARAAADLEAPALRSATGTASVRARLERIARHWRGHVDALRGDGA